MWTCSCIPFLGGSNYTTFNRKIMLNNCRVSFYMRPCLTSSPGGPKWCRTKSVNYLFKLPAKSGRDRTRHPAFPVGSIQIFCPAYEHIEALLRQKRRILLSAFPDLIALYHFQAWPLPKMIGLSVLIIPFGSAPTPSAIGGSARPFFAVGGCLLGFLQSWVWPFITDTVVENFDQDTISTCKHKIDQLF